MGELGAALTRGVQRHAMACVKHYALNSIENARFKVDVRVSPRALHEVYLPHFKRVVDEDVAAVMSSYNSVNGEWCGQDKMLLTEILKQRWGFDGFVVTDFIFGMRDAKEAALAGQDLEMPFPMLFRKDLKRLVEGGEVPAEVVDDSVLRLLRQQLRRVPAGEYDADVVGCEAHRALALEAARKSIVLLRNEAGLLPLRDVKRIAVIGRLAATPNTGDHGSSNTHPEHVVTPLEGVQAAFDGEAEVLHDDGSDLERARATAQSADAVALVVGYTYADEGEFIAPDTFEELASLFPPPSPEEAPIAAGLGQQISGEIPMASGGDRDRLSLRAEDGALIDAVAEANPRTIVAVMAGSAVVMESWREKVPAILMLWYPGMEGGHALADVLLGRVNPSGKLPFVIPKRDSDLPFFDKDATEIEYDLWHGYRKLERDGNPPAFPFGFGLSYTSFRYANLNVAQGQLETSGTLRVTADVENTGDHAGEEVVQLYVAAIGSSVERAQRELKAFRRVSLEPGETAIVDFSLPVSRLAYYDEAREDFVVEATEYEVAVDALRARFSVRET